MKAALLTAIVLGASIHGTSVCPAAQDTDYEKLFKAATFTLTEAIDKALAVGEAKECVVVNAEIEEEGGKIIYSIQLAKGDKILEINFDVTNGSQLPIENEPGDKSAQAKAAKITMKKAIETATRKPGTKVIEASLNMVEGKPVFEMKLWTEKKTEKTVKIDALSGDPIKAQKDSNEGGEKLDKKADGEGADKMAPYRTLADEAWKAFKAGDHAKAKEKAQVLEKAWDTTGKKDLAKKQDLWKEIDTAMDAYIDPLMKEGTQDAAKVEAAYKDFLSRLNKAAAP